MFITDSLTEAVAYAETIDNSKIVIHPNKILWAVVPMDIPRDAAISKMEEVL